MYSRKLILAKIYTFKVKWHSASSSIQHQFLVFMSVSLCLSCLVSMCVFVCLLCDLFMCSNRSMSRVSARQSGRTPECQLNNICNIDIREHFWFRNMVILPIFISMVATNFHNSFPAFWDPRYMIFQLFDMKKYIFFQPSE